MRLCATWRTSTQCPCTFFNQWIRAKNLVPRIYGLVLITNVIDEGSGEPVHLCNLVKVLLLTNSVLKWMKTKAEKI